MRKRVLRHIELGLMGFGALIVLLVVVQFTLVFGRRAFEGYLSIISSAAPSIIPTGQFF